MLINAMSTSCQACYAIHTCARSAWADLLPEAAPAPAQTLQPKASQRVSSSLLGSMQHNLSQMPARKLQACAHGIDGSLSKWYDPLFMHRSGDLLSEQSRRSCTVAIGSEGCNSMHHLCTHIIGSYSVCCNTLMAGVQAWLVHSIHVASPNGSCSSRQYQNLLVWLAQHLVN